MDKEKRILQAIMETLEDGIYVVSQDFNVEYMNHSMQKIFGSGEGKKCYELINRKKDICPWCQAHKVFQGERLHWELYVPHLDRTFALRELPLRNPDNSISKLSIYRDISSQKQREAKLKTTREQYQNLFHHVGVGVYISTKEGKFIDANQALLDMLGYESKDEFLNMNINSDLYMQPGDRLKFQQMIEQEGRVVDYEVDFKHREGTAVPVLLTSHVRFDHAGNVLGYEGIVVDQSQRYRMEKELKEAHDFMNKIIQSSPNPIMAADLKGNIILWNRMAEKALGYSAEEVVGKMHITKIYPEGLAYKIMDKIRSPEHGGVGMLRSQPMLYVRRDGTVIEGSLSAAMIYDEQNNEVATVGSFVDLTERIEMERALRQTQEQLMHSERLAAMGRLTSQLAHELNNPLYGIMNTLELLKTEITPENKRRRLLDMSLSETVRLTEMLRKMLSFSKPEQEEKKAVQVNQVLDEILLLHEKQLQENNIKLQTDFSPDLDLVFASVNQLRQVFLNMVSNAKDAMPEGGTLSVKTLHQNGYVIIQFQDTGVGIQKENLDKIFESFFTTKGEVKGAGLGLAVCSNFIRDHGGEIKTESTPGQGTTFIISLPVYRESE